MVPPQRLDADWKGGIFEAPHSFVPQKPIFDCYKQCQYMSLYITMRDGVRIAADVMLPHSTDKPVPVVLHQARYQRSTALRWPFKKLTGGRPTDFLNIGVKSHLLAAQYGMVVMDVRGTGASYGRWSYPWNLDEREDSAEVIKWLLQQPWCNGQICLFGVSYDANAALVAISKQPPGVVMAAAILYPFWSLYEDISYPGGVPLRSFARNWTRLVASFDRNRYDMLPFAMRQAVRSLSRGCQPVVDYGAAHKQLRQKQQRKKGRWSSGGGNDGDDGEEEAQDALPGKLSQQQLLLLPTKVGLPENAVKRAKTLARRRLKEAVHGHSSNWDGMAEMEAVRFADQRSPLSGVSTRQASPCMVAPDIKAAHVPMLLASGWLDSTASSAMHIFRNVAGPGSELILGPWGHAGVTFNPVGHDVGGAGGDEGGDRRRSRRISAFNMPLRIVDFFDRQCGYRPEGRPLEAVMPGILEAARKQQQQAGGAGGGGYEQEAALAHTPEEDIEYGLQAVATLSPKKKQQQQYKEKKGKEMGSGVRGFVKTLQRSLGGGGEGSSRQHAVESGEEHDDETVLAMWARALATPAVVAEAIAEPDQEQREQHGATGLSAEQPLASTSAHSTAEVPGVDDYHASGIPAAAAAASDGGDQAPRGNASHEARGADVPVPTVDDAPSGEKHGPVTGNGSGGISSSHSSDAMPATRGLHDCSSSSNSSSSAGVGSWNGGIGGCGNGGAAAADADATSRLVHYYVMGSSQVGWRAASCWPPASGTQAGQRTLDLFLAGAGDQGNQVLLPGTPPRHEARLAHQVNAARCPQGVSRYDVLREPGLAVSYRDLSRCGHLLLDSPPLPAAVEVDGWPLADLWVASSDGKGDVFVYLQDIHPITGKAAYVTEGVLRMGHRREPPGGRPPPGDPFEAAWCPGLPFHTFAQLDWEDMRPGGPAERCRIAMMPTSYRFAKGHRVRLAVAGGDAKHYPANKEEEGDGGGDGGNVQRTLWVYVGGDTTQSCLRLPLSQPA